MITSQQFQPSAVISARVIGRNGAGVCAGSGAGRGAAARRRRSWAAGMVTHYRRPRASAPSAPGQRKPRNIAAIMGGNAHDAIVVRGARQNNLRNLDLDLPLRELIVVT